MKRATLTKLERAGFTVGSADDFLGLSEAESRLVSLRLVLADELKRRRRENGLTQVALADQLHSSQSRVAKMEGADPTVSLDLLVKALFTLGATTRELASTLAKA